MEMACIGPYLKFSRFQWFHREQTTPIDVYAHNSRYTLDQRGTELRVSRISTDDLGKYTVQFHVGTYGPYETSARIDVAMTGGSCGKTNNPKSYLADLAVLLYV